MNIQHTDTRFFGNVFQQTRLSLKGKYARKFIFRTYRQPDFQGLSFLLQYVGISSHGSSLRTLQSLRNM